MNSVRSEWTKLRSIRSSWIAALATVVTAVTISALGVSGQLGAPASDLPTGWDPTDASLKGLLVAQITIGILGVLTITSEYATGTIRTSVAVVPRRSRLLVAKAAVLTGCALLTGLIAALVSFFTIQALLAGAGLPSAALEDPHVARAVLGAGLYLTLIGLLGLALGTFTRSTAAALGALVGLTLIVRAVAPALPEALAAWMGSFWPPSAGANVYAVVPIESAGGITPWTGFAILALFVVSLIVAGHVLVRARDV